MSTQIAMATVYQRNGVYYAKYFDADGKRVSKNTGLTKKRDAQRAAASMEADALELRAKNSEEPKAFRVRYSGSLGCDLSSQSREMCLGSF